MRRGIATVTLAVLAAAGTGSFGGDESDGASLRAGSRLRLVLVGRAAPTVGTLVQSDAEKLRVAVHGEAEARTLRWEDVASVEVGRTHQWRGFGVGTLVGAGATAGLVAASGGAPEDVGFGAAVGGLGAVPAAAAGAVVGARRSPMLGAAAGAATTGLLFLGLSVALNDPENDEIHSGPALLAGALLGALSGGAAAAVAHEAWEPVRRRTVHVSVLPIPGRGVVGGLAVSW